MNSKWNLLFDIYDPISTWSYPSLIRVFLNHIKIQLKEGNPLIYSIDIIKVGVKNRGYAKWLHQIAKKKKMDNIET